MGPTLGRGLFRLHYPTLTRSKNPKQPEVRFPSDEYPGQSRSWVPEVVLATFPAPACPELALPTECCLV